MIASPIFWKLVLHELRAKGNWRKQKRVPVHKGWWYAYFLFVVAVIVGVVTYFAIQKKINQEDTLNFIFGVSFSLPYMVFVFGNRSIGKEWDNDTNGWWLTLPYPRIWLISAKFVTLLIQLVGVVLVIMAFAILYGTLIAQMLYGMSFSDLMNTMQAGLKWMVMLVGFSPLILAVSLFTANARYSSLRPATAMLWVISMTSISFLYQGSASNIFTDKQSAFVYTLNWNMLLYMAISWVAAYLINRASAYVLEKKVSL
ncbi:ABC transporter permease [Gorillibacterium massiliense]|uniref:ABC transporter permease n=1 Tax=Gorillibacterium massiliense TaxID=1280390 RepID=UPI0004BB9F2A|nr:ABC transporter permease [Gorillibacterium massiliense]